MAGTLVPKNHVAISFFYFWILAYAQKVKIKKIIFLVAIPSPGEPLGIKKCNS